MEELSYRGEQAADMLLELIGALAKLSLLLTELPQEDIQFLSPRLNVLFHTVKELPIQALDPKNCH